MPPPLIQPKTAPRGSFSGGIPGGSRSGSTTVAPTQDADPSAQPHQGFATLAEGPPSPGHSISSSMPANVVPSQSVHAPPAQQSLPSTHSPELRDAVPPVQLPPATGDSTPRAPGSGVFVKRKVRKGTSASNTSSGELPQPSERRKSPTRTTGSTDNGSLTPGRVKSILRNPVSRHSTVTFSADMVGITMSQVEEAPLVKKVDVEQTVLRDEVFASLSGPVFSKEQITLHIAPDDDGVGLRIEGIIDHLRNMEEQSSVIRRLADFLHSPYVFGKSLAPFLTLSGALGAADRTLNHATQLILVREARINDVPIRSVAPSSARNGPSSAHPLTPHSAGRGGSGSALSVSTPQWDPEFHLQLPPSAQHAAPVGTSLSQERFEKRRRSYQAALGVLHDSPLSIPTPHHGRWDRPNAEPYLIRPDAAPAGVHITTPAVATSRSTELDQVPPSARGYTYVPHGVVDSPTSQRQAEAPALFPDGTGGARLLLREPPFLSPVGFYSSSPMAHSSAPQTTLYRTRQYVTEEAPRARVARGPLL